MIQPPRILAAVSAVTAGTGTLSPADAIFAGSGSGFAVGGKAGAAGGGETGDGAAAIGAAGMGAADGGVSLLTVAIVVTFAAVATAGAGVSCRLSDGNGDSEAV